MKKREHRDYGVIILNYNTANDAIAAANSIIKNAGNHSYIICIVDNASTKKGEVETLKSEKLPNTEIVALNNNCGYAKGNNEGVRFLLDNYIIDYLVIMNPDVLILNTGSIDRLINRFDELPARYAGIQPWHFVPHRNIAPNMYRGFRRLNSYIDILATHCKVLRPFFKKRFEDLRYTKERPYKEEMDFEVPSGAFFIMRMTDFVKVGMFDERTFLYCEEYILGHKVKTIGKTFRLIPNEWIEHEGGKSIGSNYSKPKWYMVKYDMQAHDIYMKYYLRCNKPQIWFIHICMVMNYCLMSIIYKIKNVHN